MASEAATSGTLPAAVAGEHGVLLEVAGLKRYFDVSPPLLNRLIERAGRRIVRAVDDHPRCHGAVRETVYHDE